MPTSKILRGKEVCAIMGVSEQTISRWVKVGSFPAPLKLGPRRIGWEQSAVESFLASKRENIKAVEDAVMSFFA